MRTDDKPTQTGHRIRARRRFRVTGAKVDALKKLQSESAAELDAPLPSILDQAFRGELV